MSSLSYPALWTGIPFVISVYSSMLSPLMSKRPKSSSRVLKDLTSSFQKGLSSPHPASVDRLSKRRVLALDLAPGEVAHDAVQQEHEPREGYALRLAFVGRVDPLENLGVQPAIHRLGDLFVEEGVELLDREGFGVVRVVLRHGARHFRKGVLDDPRVGGVPKEEGIVVLLAPEVEEVDELPEVERPVPLEIHLLEQRPQLRARREAAHAQLPLQLGEHEVVRPIVVKVCESDLQKFEGLFQERRKAVVLGRSDVVFCAGGALLKNFVRGTEGRFIVRHKGRRHRRRRRDPLATLRRAVIRLGVSSIPILLRARRRVGAILLLRDVPVRSRPRGVTVTAISARWLATRRVSAVSPVPAVPLGRGCAVTRLVPVSGIAHCGGNRKAFFSRSSG
mmetsp:Transcript_2202/g.5082  ORF Transcript_2202/g.5082 Transcript_2202/m.5082 type:complete len:392 (-) Transcript_2202:90-1265(-)